MVQDLVGVVLVTLFGLGREPLDRVTSLDIQLPQKLQTLVKYDHPRNIRCKDSIPNHQTPNGFEVSLDTHPLTLNFPLLQFLQG